MEVSLYPRRRNVLRPKARSAAEVDTLWYILVIAVSEGECRDVICAVDVLER